MLWHCTTYMCMCVLDAQVNVTADHRIIYGADVAEFLQTLASIVENPSQLTL